MRKLELKHVDAISHAEVYIRPVIQPNMTACHREAIENDLELLSEIKKHLLLVIYGTGALYGNENSPKSDR